jgi:hypothetical protein
LRKNFSSGNYQSKNFNYSKKIRIIQRVFSLAFLIMLIFLPIYYSLPTPTEAEIAAVKLNVKVHLVSDTEITIIVTAVSETGKLDTKRNDEIELSFEGPTSSKPLQSRAKLENGEARIRLLKKVEVSSILKAKWISGPTPLRDGKILVSPLMWDY